MAAAERLVREVASVFDLKVGDRVCHGRNYGTVMGVHERGPYIAWDGGRVDYWYDEEMHQVHPLHLVE
jgi:hypothetical protein